MAENPASFPIYRYERTAKWCDYHYSGNVTWEEDFLAKQVLTLYFTDGRALEMEDALTQRIQRGTHAIHIEFVEASEQRAPLCHLSLLSPRLLDPDSVTGLELNGQWYEFPAA